ncbi:hypothetical protein SPRG_06514 [Saprolegnia parasitica CBS 223.65]|uniref:Uncharacterized protein n=1 Tax=Saprolegnia parasitica (strain CBS 223.65) TaxID=695850 RepID=A0A067CD29_SAPPC|nr:hypothetical protein SPRG_06514 [Saprolegnia parasitica CBS 223.65]KDO28659.1 hypothetical protein SPRG_06514 [Saprolegnia parasitica CBS 223.65]|eukprot:XP_012200719.1 hypothetical protein SPRG_06514 [Saprolegnia parasitica CBS 223.65]
MAATFHHVVLHQPSIASMVFEFHFGLYEDVRSAVRACKQLVALDAARGVYTCDASFPTAFALNVVWDGPMHFRASSHSLRSGKRDDRLPLHLAIAEGFMQLTQRMLRCRPDLAYEDAILLAFYKNRLETVELLLELRSSVPELYRRFDAGSPPGYARRPNFIVRSILPAMLAREDSKGVELLQRFDSRPDIFALEIVRDAILSATLDNLTLAVNTFSRLVYPGLLDDIAGRGFLPLVRTLHERGCSCSERAMDYAAANGHLEVVQFLHFNRTEGCTTYALDRAIYNGHFDVVCFLIEHRMEGASPNILDRAAADSRIDIDQYLHLRTWILARHC